MVRDRLDEERSNSLRVCADMPKDGAPKGKLKIGRLEHRLAGNEVDYTVMCSALTIGRGAQGMRGLARDQRRRSDQRISAERCKVAGSKALQQVEIQWKSIKWKDVGVSLVKIPKPTARFGRGYRGTFAGILKWNRIGTTFVLDWHNVDSEGPHCPAGLDCPRAELSIEKLPPSGSCKTSGGAD